MYQRFMLLTIGLLGGMAVALGTSGSHGLKDILTQNGYAEVFQTANRYHFYHTFALAFLYLLPQNKISKIAFWCFLIGILIFSGSLYVLSLTQIKILGAITPFGGVALLAGWFLTGLVGIKKIPDFVRTR